MLSEHSKRSIAVRNGHDSSKATQALLPQTQYSTDLFRDQLGFVCACRCCFCSHCQSAGNPQPFSCPNQHPTNARHKKGVTPKHPSAAKPLRLSGTIPYLIIADFNIRHSLIITLLTQFCRHGASSMSIHHGHFRIRVIGNYR